MALVDDLGDKLEIIRMVKRDKFLICLSLINEIEALMAIKANVARELEFIRYCNMSCWRYRC